MSRPPEHESPRAVSPARGRNVVEFPIGEQDFSRSGASSASESTAAECVRVPRGQGSAILAEEQAHEGIVTQDGTALLFVQRYGGQLRFDYDARAWFHWNDSRWLRDRSQLAFSFARSLARDMAEHVEILEKAAIRKVSFARGVEEFARADQALAVSANAWDPDPFLLGTPSGSVDLRTGQLHPARQGDMITRHTAVVPTEVADCPTWLRFLEETFCGNAEVIRFVQQFAGYALTGDTTEQRFIFGEGKGGNGKGVLVTTLLGILADYGGTVAMETLTASKHDRHPTEIARLKGLRLVVASETEAGREWAEARIKLLTGGDKLTARFMRQDDFEFTPNFKLLVMGNNRPSLRNVDEAMRRRLIVVQFNNDVPREKRDPELPEKLKAEWPSILRWMIDGCLDWQANRLVCPEDVLSSTDEYFEAQDVFGHWLQDECEIDQGNIYRYARSSDLSKNWTDYARANGEEAGTTKSFAARMKNKGFLPVQKSWGRGYEGIRLRKGIA